MSAQKVLFFAVACQALATQFPLLAEEPKARVTLQAHTRGVSSVAFSPDGKILASVKPSTRSLWHFSKLLI
jgi:hypothetical protein